MIARMKYSILVSSQNAACACDEEGNDPTPKVWAEGHKRKHLYIYLELIGNLDEPSLEGTTLRGAYGDSPEGWSVGRTDDGLPVVFDANGVCLDTTPLGTHVVEGKPAMSLRVPRPNAPVIEIVTI